MSEAASRVLPVANLREFFRDSLQGALARQHLAVEDQTEHYVVNLLTLFARSEALYERTPEGMRLRPLVVLLCEAFEAPSVEERNRLHALTHAAVTVAGSHRRHLRRAHRSRRLRFPGHRPWAPAVRRAQRHGGRGADRGPAARGER